MTYDLKKSVNAREALGDLEKALHMSGSRADAGALFWARMALEDADARIIELEVAEAKLAKIAALKPSFMKTAHRGYSVEDFSRPLVNGSELKAILDGDVKEQGDD